jgi:hypothetical protein
LLRPATPTDANLRAGMFGGEQDTHNVNPIIKSRHDFDIMDESKPTNTAASASPPPAINPDDLIGRSFLMDKQEYGQQYRGRIFQLIEGHESMVEDNPTRIIFRVSVNNDQEEEIIMYTKLLDYLSKDLEIDIVWKFRRIISHNCPFQVNHPEYKYSQYNLMI